MWDFVHLYQHKEAEICKNAFFIPYQQKKKKIEMHNFQSPSSVPSWKKKPLADGASGHLPVARRMEMKTSNITR